MGDEALVKALLMRLQHLNPSGFNATPAATRRLCFEESEAIAYELVVRYRQLAFDLGTGSSAMGQSAGTH